MEDLGEVCFLSYFFVVIFLDLKSGPLSVPLLAVPFSLPVPDSAVQYAWPSWNGGECTGNFEVFVCPSVRSSIQAPLGLLLCVLLFNWT